MGKKKRRLSDRLWNAVTLVICFAIGLFLFFIFGGRNLFVENTPMIIILGAVLFVLGLIMPKSGPFFK